MNEMSSIGRKEWPGITMVVFRNYQWGAEKRNSILWFDDNFVGTELDPHLSYAKVAEGCGLKGVAVRTPAELTEALRASCEAQKTARHDLHRGHPQSGARRAVPPRRHEETGAGRRHPARGHARRSRPRSEGMTMTVAVKSPADAHHKPVIDEVMRRARAAFESFRDVSQERADEAVRALAWSVYKPEHARELAALAVADTGLGNVPDKIVKNQRKTFGTLRDLLRAKSVGIIEEDKAKGIVKYAKPMGVIAALTPSTNPAATPVNKAMMAIKGRNAVVIAPSPLGYETTKRTVDYMRAALEQAGLPADLVQILPPPVTKELTEALMKAADLVVVTGSQDNVRRAAMSGTPAIGVGAGNVPVIIDETADLADAARKIRASKIFDNSTSCSSENSVIILDAIYDKAIAALTEVGGYLCTAREKAAVQQALWHHGKLNRHLIARDAGHPRAGFRLAG